MIECSNEKIWYKRKKRTGKRIKRTFIVLFLITSFILYYRFCITVQILNICTDTVYSKSAAAINTAVNITLSDNVKYTDLITVEKDAQGNISFMTTNAQKINAISREIANNTQILLKTELNNGMPIPYLAFTGISLISAYGKTINIKCLTVPTAYCEFFGNFTSVGINQTLHSIYVKATCKVNFELPFYKKQVNFTSDILISETVLIGKVPEIYLNGQLFR